MRNSKKKSTVGYFFNHKHISCIPSKKGEVVGNYFDFLVNTGSIGDSGLVLELGDRGVADIISQQNFIQDMGERAFTFANNRRPYFYTIINFTNNIFHIFLLFFLFKHYI